MTTFRSTACAAATPAANGRSTPPVYTTAYDFESLQDLTLSGAEIISHHYYSGGNIQQIYGRGV